MDGSQKEGGGNFLNLLQKKGVPRKGGSLRKGGGFQPWWKLCLAGSKIADKITSLKVSDDQKPQKEREEDAEIIIPPHQRQKIIDDLRLF